MLHYIVLLCCFTAVPAMIVESPADADLLMPEPLALTCVASGVPPANFTWQIDYLNGSSVLLTESIGDITIMPPSTSDNQTTSILRIGSTERLHTGNYTCIAQNEQNVSPVTSDTAEVNVYGKSTVCIILCCVPCVCMYPPCVHVC